jgi:Tfp pilus assembly protein PilX
MRLRPSSQRGAALIIGIIMLVLITLAVAAAFSMSSGNLKAVGNMQSREQAIASANRAIEQVVGSAFAAAPAADTILVDLDNDGKTDYTVQVAPPTCLRGTPVAGSGGAGQGSSLSLGLGSALQYNAVWDITATVNDESSGTAVTVRQGVRVLMSQADYDTNCP